MFCCCIFFFCPDKNAVQSKWLSYYMTQNERFISWEAWRTTRKQRDMLWLKGSFCCYSARIPKLIWFKTPHKPFYINVKIIQKQKRLNVKHMLLEVNRRRKRFFLETEMTWVWDSTGERGWKSVVLVLLCHTIIKNCSKKLDHSVSLYVPRKDLWFSFSECIVFLSNFPSLSHYQLLQ